MPKGLFITFEGPDGWVFVNRGVIDAQPNLDRVHWTTSRHVDIVNPKFHRYAILVAISLLSLIAIGAYVTSQAGGRQPASGVLIMCVSQSNGKKALIRAVSVQLPAIPKIRCARLGRPEPFLFGATHANVIITVC